MRFTLLLLTAALLASCSDTPTQSTAQPDQTSSQPAQTRVVDLSLPAEPAQPQQPATAPTVPIGPYIRTPNNAPLNLRDSQGNVLQILPAGTEVNPTGAIAPDGYLPVKVGNQAGFVFAQYVANL
jgi:hypothetical protein